MVRLLLVDGVIDLNRGEVARGKEPVRLTPTERELLAYLASRAGRDVSTEELHQRVWGHSVHVVSRAVTLAVHRLRRKLERDAARPVHLVTGPNGYRWVPPPSSTPVHAGRVVLVVAEPTVPGDSRWLTGCAELVRDGVLSLVELAPDRVVFASGSDGAALDTARALVGLAETRIGVASGPAEALVDPLSGRTLYGGATLERAARLARSARPGEVPTAPDDATASPRVSVARVVPFRSDPFVGRDDVLRELLAVAADGARPIVVGGPAGAGKSRLAEELVTRLGRTGWFVSLEGADLVDAVGSALGLPPGPDPVGRIGAALSVRGPVVLVLDGAERIAAELGPIVARWQGDAPDALLVVTSRERPAIAGAHVHELGGLSTDEGAALLRARCPTLPPQARLDALVHALDGLPLALELVAPRLRVLGVEEVRSRLHHLLDAAGTGHRSLRSALMDSWDRLDDAQRSLLVRATVFAGPFGLDDAEGVLGAERPAEAPWFVDTLVSLCDRYLVQAEIVGDHRRFRLLGVVRTFAEEHRAAWLGDAERRHAERFAALLDQVHPVGPPPFGASAMPELARAVAAGVRHGWPDLAARAALAHTRGSQFYGDPEGSLGQVDAAIALGPDPRSLARLIQARSQLLRRAGRSHDALEAIHAAVARAEALGDTELQGRFEIERGLAWKTVGDFPGALAAFGRAEALLGTHGNDEMRRAVRLNRASVHQALGAYADGLREVLPLLETRDESLRAVASGIAGALMAASGDLEGAVSRLSVAVAVLTSRPDPFTAANFRLLLADTLEAQGRPDDAAAEFETAVVAMRELGSGAWVSIAYTHLATLELSRDALGEARRWIEDATPWVRRCDDPNARGRYHAARCELLGREGDAVGSLQAAHEASGLLAPGGHAVSLGVLAVHRGMAAWAEGDADRSRHELMLAEATIERLGLRPWSGLAREARRLRRALQRVS